MIKANIITCSDWRWQVIENHKLGLIINPIAGIGGKAGLKGSDQRDCWQRAIQMGLKPEANHRAVTALKVLRTLAPGNLALWTGPHEMGETAALEARFNPQVIGKAKQGATTGSDSERIAREMLAKDLDLLLFVGGDGTARNICASVGHACAVLGIPAGVKMHSAVFAVNPGSAARLTAEFLQHKLPVASREVMDIDEDRFRRGVVDVKLYGHLLVPESAVLVQGAKAAGQSSDDTGIRGIAATIAERMDGDSYWVFGPGGTTQGIMHALGLEGTLLGVDLVQDGEIVARDLNEPALNAAVAGQQVRIVLTPIGGQGHILGRGNQQIGPSLILQAGKENLVIVSLLGKLATIPGGALLVDTGSDEVDQMLRGPIRVLTGYRHEHVCRIH
ncbi:MAG: ATP-NAD kinase [Firmicutes bacterium]|nr:ATP-NAD kinase [Bacillota bacterium]